MFDVFNMMLMGMNGQKAFMYRAQPKRKPRDWDREAMQARRETCGVLVKNPKQEAQMNAMHDAWYEKNKHRFPVAV